MQFTIFVAAFSLAASVSAFNACQGMGADPATCANGKRSIGLTNQVRAFINARNAQPAVEAIKADAEHITVDAE